MDFKLLYKFIPGVVIIAIFAYSFMALLKRSKYIEKQQWFKHFSNFFPPIIGAILGGSVPYFFPEEAPIEARLIVGALSGMNMGYVIAFIRRYIRSKQSGKTGLPAVLDATVSIVDHPVDAVYGKTIPPTGEIKKQENLVAKDNEKL